MVFTNSADVRNFDFQIYINPNDPGNPETNDKIKIEQINNNSVTPAVKFLGVYVDQQLNFKYHINYIEKKLQNLYTS